MKPFSPEIKAKIRFLYVDEGKSALAISKKYKGNPSAQTISLWAKINGWDKERTERTHDEYEKLSPQHLANKILKHIGNILDKKGKSFTTKDADALAKLRVSMEKITDKKYQIPMMYELLTNMIDFLNKNYKQFITDEFLNAIRHFKNELKADLEGSALRQAIGD
jgi:transposase